MRYEVECKSLLGSEERASALLARMKEIDPLLQRVSQNKQLNHYFLGNDVSGLPQVFSNVFSHDLLANLRTLVEKGKECSVRTREKDGQTFLVVKASVDDTTSSNGIKRMEFEEEVDMTLDSLDRILLENGFSYQAKWSREREEYICKGMNVCLDRNAGYGWLAEFETIVSDEALLHKARSDVQELMKECGVEELKQERLERMFTFYNRHWQDYYGTDRIFTVE